MTAEQYWDGDCTLARAYRKADEIRQERVNTELWSLGGYIYDALQLAAPLPIAFVKKGEKSRPYLSEPYPLSGKQSSRRKEVQEKKAFQNGKRFMEQFMVSHNRKYEGK